MSPKPLFDESDLLQRVAMGDEHAFRTLYHAYKRKVYTYALGVIHTPEAAEEITQEVFLKIWRMGPELLAIQQFEPFLKKMARNRSLDAIRRLTASAKAERLLTKNYREAHNETEEALQLKETRGLVDAAISRLPRQQQEVFILCQQEGLKYEEAADRMHISVNTVKTHMKRALSALREDMGTYSDIAAILIVLKII